MPGVPLQPTPFYKCRRSIWQHKLGNLLAVYSNILDCVHCTYICNQETYVYICWSQRTQTCWTIAMCSFSFIVPCLPTSWACSFACTLDCADCWDHTASDDVFCRCYSVTCDSVCTWQWCHSWHVSWDDAIDSWPGTLDCMLWTVSLWVSSQIRVHVQIAFCKHNMWCSLL